MDRTRCMCRSIVCFCASNPCRAAFSTSELKPPVCVGMYSDYAAVRDPFELHTASPPSCSVGSMVWIGHEEEVGEVTYRYVLITLPSVRLHSHSRLRHEPAFVGLEHLTRNRCGVL